MIVLDSIPANISADAYMMILDGYKAKHPDANLAMRPSEKPGMMFDIIDSDHEFSEESSPGSISMRKFVAEDEGVMAELAIQGNDEYEEGLKYMAHVWYDALIRTGAANFVEFNFELDNYRVQPHKHEKFSVLIQRKDAETPVDQRNAARQRITELEDILGDVYLYIKWRWITSQLTTEQKELFADAVEAWSARLNDGSDEEPIAVERWWRD